MVKKVEKEAKAKKAKVSKKEEKTKVAKEKSKATKVIKTKKVEETKPQVSTDFLADYFLGAVDKVEKEEQLTTSVNDSYRLPTGLLAFDVLLDGGLNASWFQISGQEASFKSGCALNCAKTCYEAGVPVVYYFDAENAVKKKFMCSIFNTDTQEEVIGKRDEKGNWLVRPKIRYSIDNSLEKVFITMKKTLLRLPDKMQDNITGKWYYVFGKDKDSQKQMSEMGFTGTGDAKLHKITGKYWFEAPNDTLQAFFVIDSLPALVPQEASEDEDKVGQRIAYLAGPLSGFVPQVKGLLKRKHSAIFIVNQMRDKPMVMFGDPQSEPGGNAVKFFSEFRLRFVPIAVPQGWDRKKESSNICQEKSVEGNGYDYYMFKKMRVVKTKTSAVGATSMCRVWIKDKDGNPRSYDPVFDAWQTLNDLHLVSGSRNGARGFKIHIKGMEDISFDWEMFKYCILIETKKSKALWERFKAKYNPEFTKPLKIRKHLMDLIAKGNLDKYSVKEDESSETEVNLEEDI